MCARSLETTTKFASVLLHATRRPSPPLETDPGVLGFFGLIRFVPPHGLFRRAKRVREARRCLMPGRCGQRRTMLNDVQVITEGERENPNGASLARLKGRMSTTLATTIARICHPWSQSTRVTRDDATVCRHAGGNSLPNPRSVLQ